jgi:MFS family permease
MWSILLIAAVQMPNLALSPSINQIQTTVFPDYSLSTIQTTMQLPNLISPFLTIFFAFLIGKGILTKRGTIIAGLFIVGFTGALAIVAHSQFWQFCLLSTVLGIGLSGYISNATSLIFDNFSDEERQYISGYQTSFINGGGIVMSLCGGALAGLVWYGGYLMLLLAVPVAIIALFAIPRVKPRRDQTDKSAGQPREKLHPDVFLYSASIFIFMLIYCVGGSNISTHLAPLGSTALSGVATAIQMAGGVVCGLFFGTLSIKLRDKMMSLAFVAIFVGMMILSLFPNSVVMSFVGMLSAAWPEHDAAPVQCSPPPGGPVRAISALATSLTSCNRAGFGAFSPPWSLPTSPTPCTGTPRCCATVCGHCGPGDGGAVLPAGDVPGEESGKRELKKSTEDARSGAVLLYFYGSLSTGGDPAGNKAARTTENKASSAASYAVPSIHSPKAVSKSGILSQPFSIKLHMTLTECHMLGVVYHIIP